MDMKTAFFIALLVAFAGCRREDIREMTVVMPGLDESARSAVVQALSKYQGVQKDSYVWDMGKKTLTLRYDSMAIAQTNIRMAIAEKGVEVEFPENTTGRAGH
jgi:hypothetical protein